MYDHTHIIRRLNEAQKIRLLTDIHSLEDPELAALGLPRLRCESVADAGGGLLPSLSLLARSWNPALMSDAAEIMGRELVGNGVNYVFLPEAKARLTPFGEGFSEDPLLAGELAEACLSGVERAEVAAGLLGYGLTPREQAHLDRPVSSRIRHTFLDAPYVRALNRHPHAGIVLGHGRETVSDAVAKAGSGAVFCLRAEGAETVRVLAEGRICLSGSAPAVQAALHNYRRLATAIEQGKATTGELETACREGEAISEAKLDEALVRLLDLAETCFARKGKNLSDAVLDDMKKLQRRAIAASTVLLSNRPLKGKKRPILPLRDPKRVCVVGEMVFADRPIQDTIETLKGAFPSVSFAMGYNSLDDRDDELIQEAVSTAEEADLVILMIGTNARREARLMGEGRCTFPANLQALCDRISMLGKPTVAVISSHMTPDLSFLTAIPQAFSAVLLAPLEAADGLEVILDILKGREAPAGRLPVTLYAREDHPSLLREDRKVGPFVGYRYTDTLGCGALFPFGHGLTYTAFRYSNLRLAEGTVQFTVRNTGKRSGTEVAQVYVGMQSSAVLRPRKELAAFACLELAPGESRTVTLPLEFPVICEDDGALRCERGTYTVSVGASVSDIRLETTAFAGQDALVPDGELPEVYLPSLSNIHSQQYMMEAEYLPMKPSLRNLILGAAALCLAVSVKIYDVVSRSNALFLDIVALILAAGAGFCFVLELLDRRKQHAIEDARIAEADERLFENADIIAVPSAEDLFAAEDWLEQATSAEAVEDCDTADGGYDGAGDINKELSLDEAVRELATLAREKGIFVSDETLRSVLSSLLVSHLSVVYGMDEKDFSALIALLGEYFACTADVDMVDDSFRGETDVLFASDRDGNRVPRHTLRALLAARNHPGRVHIAALGGVDPETMSAYFVPFARHAHAPLSGCTVECHDIDGGDITYVLPENLWFLVNLKPGTAYCRLPAYVTEIATVHRWNLEVRGRGAESHTEFRHFGYGQMEYLRDRLRSEFSAEEDSWKKLDRLEAYAAGYADFRIGNKVWLGLEMYMAALMSCGAEESAARDEAMAVKLIPTMVTALDGRIPRDKRGLSETLDTVFGDDQTLRCRKAVKDSGADLV